MRPSAAIAPLLVLCSSACGLLMAAGEDCGGNPNANSGDAARAPDRPLADHDLVDSATDRDAMAVDGLHWDTGRDAGCDAGAPRDAPGPFDAARPNDGAGSLDTGGQFDSASAVDSAIADNDIPHPRDLCQSDNVCTNGHCRRLPDAPGAVHFCVNDFSIWTQPCVDGGMESQPCCSSSECPPADGGPAPICAAFQVGYCGGAMPPPNNVCRYPECSSDSDCGPHRACIPSGAFSYFFATCLPAECRIDADCTARTGGSCRPLGLGQCNRVAGFFCAYQGDVCASDVDCETIESGQRCIPADGGTACVLPPEFPP